MGLSHTIMLCFEKAVYHRPELCPRQFAGESIRMPKTKDLVITRYRRGNNVDWSNYKKMQKYIDVWQKMRNYSIGSSPIHAGVVIANNFTT